MFTLTPLHLEKYTLEELSNPEHVSQYNNIIHIDLGCDIDHIVYRIVGLFQESDVLILLVSKFVLVHSSFIMEFTEEDYNELNECRMENRLSEKDKILIELSKELCLYISRLTSEKITYHIKSSIEDRLMRASCY